MESCPRPLITLTTDFGLHDPYVGIMKGVILNVYPNCRIIDITHAVHSQDILGGGFALKSSYRFFPKGSIHVAVVDPGVGSLRRPILFQTENYFFVGPDNGIFSPSLEEEHHIQAYHLTSDRFFLKPTSHTFHGRDIFAPVAGWLARGTPPHEFGPLIEDWVKLSLPALKHEKGGLQGTILWIDKFGNVITNIKAGKLPDTSGQPVLRVGNHEIANHLSSYSEGLPGALFTIWGSSGFLEISANRESAAALLGVQAGRTFEIVSSL
ncbi:MAG: SAM-dependent chlorinase/fluorinase [Terriglobia bacterium]